jgi:hypothetical protein
MPFAERVVALAAAAVLMNLPLGWLRAACVKYSLKWFLYIHLSIPFLLLFRRWLGISYLWIPVSLGCAVVGQVVGARLRNSEGA